MSTYAVGECRSNRSNCRYGHEEDAIEHGSLNSDISHAPCFEAKCLVLFLWLTVESDQERPRDVKSLGHGRSHLRIQIEGGEGQSLDLLSDPLGRDQKEGKQQ